MHKIIFKDFDFYEFWGDIEYALESYLEESPSDGLIKSIEEEVGYKLPASYIELMKAQNGGSPNMTCFPTNERTSWAEDHIAISGIMGIGREKSYSLCGDLGSQFMIDSWGYPNIGICICNCPSAGHDMVMLDYSKCGKNGEPEVVHVDQESDYKTTFLAKDFESFIRGLVSDEVYDTSEQDLIDTLKIFETGEFSDILQEYFQKDKSINFDKVLRSLFTELTEEKGYFGLHADGLSYLAYDIQFYLLSINEKIKSKKGFIENYPPMVALSNNGISTGGCGNFYEDWFDTRIKQKNITKGIFSSFQFTEKYKSELMYKIKKYE